MNHTYSYVRVSSKDQNEDRQLIAMKEFGVTERNIFSDKQSGKNVKRQAYQKLLKKINSGDTFVIKSIGRLCRDYEDIIGQWRVVSKEREVGIVVLDMPLLDTRQKDRDLTGTFIADLVLQILSYVTQTDREFNRQCQAEGIAAAKQLGIDHKTFAQWTSES